MIFVFDWGYITSNQIGPLSKEEAVFNLDADMVWLVRDRVWFRLFFIPTIPTQTRYFFNSTIDESRQEIDNATFMKYRDLARLNARLMNDEIDDEAYWRQRKNLDFD